MQLPPEIICWTFRSSVFTMFVWMRFKGLLVMKMTLNISASIFVAEAKMETYFGCQWGLLCCVAAEESKIYTQPALTAMLLWPTVMVLYCMVLVSYCFVLVLYCVVDDIVEGVQYCKHTFIITVWPTLLKMVAHWGRVTKVVSPSHHTSALALHMSPHHRLFHHLPYNHPRIFVKSSSLSTSTPHSIAL